MFKKARRLAAARRDLAGRVTQGSAWPARPHGLPRHIVLSVTSYPARFEGLAQTLLSLLFQTVRPDVTVLWIAHADLDRLPPEVRDLARFGLEIRGCDDILSFKKIIPTLEAFPDSIVVTADDDIYYWPSWFEELVAAHASGHAVVCHRAHLVRCGPDGMPLGYRDWISAPERAVTGPQVFPTGVMGVLYDPRAFHPEVTRRDLFMALCPRADDVWLWWMHRLRGSRPHLLGLGHKQIEWPGSQDSNLRSLNMHEGGNDAAIAAMIAHYGFPADGE
ncbi:glycosyltransferase family 2 protein [Sinirhodobacter ferrireducens]|uniref:Glycosyltransferase family 2 protein n=1 Tax=Paenirhodobacter ferrireducens TaxID=1215032 RepID=A0A443LBP8_9RHOB|nr:glycosyltransferase family 2 protein [Sinirhodobacter ferrireducens]RWR46613.1 glycosyltransferase family 2 protein [Sinirhodobacter ferrireducens]